MKRSMGNSVWCLLLGLSLSVDSRAAPHPAGSDPELAKGIQQVNDGDLEAAIATLDGVLARAGSDPNRAPEAAQAHLYKGIVFASLERADDARGSFVEALKRNWLLHLDPSRFPPKVTEVFGAAREEARRLGYEPAKPSQKPAIGGLGILGIVGGVLAVGGAAVAVAGGGGQSVDNAPPTTSLTVTPQGQVIASVTRVVFTGTASDPDGDPLAYTWTFGDGAMASSATVEHVYMEPGEYDASLTVADGRGKSATATARVSAGLLTGRWIEALNDIDLIQTGSRLQGHVREQGGLRGMLSGSLSSPRMVAFEINIDLGFQPFSCRQRAFYQGEVEDSLKRIFGRKQVKSCISKSETVFTMSRKP